jgi:hypothetical protein
LRTIGRRRSGAGARIAFSFLAVGLSVFGCSDEARNVAGQSLSDAASPSPALAETGVDGGLPDTGLGDASAVYRNVMTYGARGDGVTDDSNAIQMAIDAASAGEVVFLPAPATFYRISSPDAACPTFLLITSSDVQIRSLSLVGPQQDCGHAIDVGTGAVIRNVTLTDNRIESFYGGINLTRVDGFRLVNNAIAQMNYFGITTSGSNGGVIDKNTVLGVSGNNAQLNAYGIVATRSASNPSNPRSTNITISNNRVEDVPIWECYDTHGGQADALAPLDCEVRGNTVEKNASEPYRDAIVFAGTQTQYATGSINGNLLIGFGTTGIYVVNTNVAEMNTTRR